MSVSTIDLLTDLVFDQNYGKVSFQVDWTNIWYCLCTIQECQYKQATSLILESHKLIGSADELYWFETLGLIADSQRDDSSLKQSKQKASSTCVDALNMFKEEFQRRPAEVSTSGYVMGLLEAK